ncbi:MAG: hypothetical protein HDR01_02235 [Lachnospiraceae bacterium]|nr:hypothetical protein [Lachnospiraceae bacterium]
MTFDDIKASEIREKIFPMILEEACRQWCAFIDDVPERADGEGFAEFFFEIFEAKELEYAEQIYEQEAQEAVKTPKEKNR